MDKRTPAFAPYIQKFINRVYEGDAMHGHEVFAPEYFSPVFIKGPEFAKGKGPLSDGPSSSHGPSQKNGIAISQFFNSMFTTCRDARAYCNDAREFAKEGCRIQNAYRRVAGLTTKVDSPELAPSAFVDIPMPPVTDEDFLFGALQASGTSIGSQDGEAELDRVVVEEEPDVTSQDFQIFENSEKSKTF